MFKFVDGFASHAVTADLANKWQPAPTGWTFGAGRGKFGGGSLYSDGTAASGNIMSSKLAALNSGESILGFYAKFSTNPASLSPFAGVYTSSGGRVASLRLNTSGVIGVYGASADGLMFTSLGVMTDNKFHWFEWRNFMQSGSAVVALYIDNLLVGNVGAGNQGGSADHFGFITINGVEITLDQVVLYDDTAGFPTFTNFPIGSRQITTLRPASDSALQFTTLVGGDGTHHYASLNETVPDNDASYVEDGTIGNQDLLVLSAMPYTPATISGIMVNLQAENAIGGAINLQAVVKSGATQANGASIITPLVYSTLQWPFSVDPNTGAAWTPSGLAAATVGYKNA